MVDDDAVARQVKELESLSKRKIVTDTSLGQCEALLELLPVLLLEDNPSPAQKAIRFRRLLNAAVKRALENLAAEPQNARIHDILAGATVLGLISSAPDNFKGSLSNIQDTKGKTPQSVGYRQALAGLWLLRPVTAAKTFRRHMPRCLEAFRYALLEFVSDASVVNKLAAEMRPMPINKPIANLYTVMLDTSTLTPRPTLLEACLRTLNQTGRACLIGEMGTGKSALATMLAATASPVEEPILLRRQQFMEDAVEVLEAHGVATRGSHSAVLMRDLRTILASTSRPVIMDNVEDWEVVASLISDDAHCWLIVTSNRRPPEAWDRHVVAVPDMTPAEASAMASSIAPRLTEAQAARLVESLRYRPLAIAQVCGYLAKNDVVTPDMIQQMLDRRMGLALETVAATTKENLRLIHAHTLRELEETYPAAVRLLEVLAFGQALESDQRGPGIDHADQVCYLMLGLRLGADEVRTGLLVHGRAVELLQERQLITVGFLGGWMHAVTAAVLRDLFEPGVKQIGTRLLAVQQAGPHAYLLRLAELSEPVKSQVLEFLGDNVSAEIYGRLADGLSEAESHRDERAVRIMYELAPAQGWLFKKAVFDADNVQSLLAARAKERAAELYP